MKETILPEIKTQKLLAHKIIIQMAIFPRIIFPETIYWVETDNIKEMLPENIHFLN